MNIAVGVVTQSDLEEINFLAIVVVKFLAMEAVMVDHQDQLPMVEYQDQEVMVVHQDH